MTKGRYGILLTVYPILAFVLVLTGQPLLCGIIFAVAFLLEKDEFTTRQTFQALALSLCVEIFEAIRIVIGLLAGIPIIGGILIALFGLISVVVYIAAVVFSIIAIVRLLKAHDANIPFLSVLSYKLFGQVKPKSEPQYQVPPVYQNTYNDPNSQHQYEYSQSVPPQYQPPQQNAYYSNPQNPEAQQSYYQQQPYHNTGETDSNQEQNGVQ